MTNKIVLAYSGGLDTSVAVPWLKENYDAEIITVTIDLGMVDLDSIKQRAIEVGADKAVTIDAKAPLVTDYIWPALKAGAIYEEEYPLATALGRPLIAKCLVDVAKQEGAYAIAHGCTGKGNDQVRIEVSAAALMPEIKLIAPIRDWGMSRADEIEYANERNLPINVKDSRFSVDENLWGRSAEAGELEDPGLEPPEEAFTWTTSPNEAPDSKEYIELEFIEGIPVSLNNIKMNGIELIVELNKIAGNHGIGRIDHVENRLVGIKSREIYESPAGIVLHTAHKSLEDLTLSRDQARFKHNVSREYSEIVYNGLWFSRHRLNLDRYIDDTQKYVSGKIQVCLYKGKCTVTGRESDQGLYSKALATYDRDDEFDHASAEGFIKIFGLSLRTENINE
ncbi:MAG: argininosuccinate synthase [Dehalococcoidia bacterium]|tara:strand:+ start:10728 stop:11909 length:1182 start_codon:yes stop_codon:yes gene_type:complete